MSGINIPTHYTDMYSSNVAHLLQNAGGAYRSAVMEKTCSGEQAVMVNQFGAAEMSEVTTRFEVMSRTDPATQRVWLTPKSWDLPLMVDSFDLLKVELIDPESELTQTGMKAAKRKLDDLVSDAFFATILTGQRAGSTQTFDTTNHRVDAAIGAAADTGMNVEKMIRARRILLTNEVDLDTDDLYLAIHPNQEEDLLNQAKVINSDFAGGTVLRDGKIDRFCGFKIICTTKVPSNSSYRLNPAWVKSGMSLGIWADVKTSVDRRADLRGIPNQLYLTLTANATRTEAGRVIQIESTEA